MEDEDEREQKAFVVNTAQEISGDISLSQGKTNARFWEDVRKTNVHDARIASLIRGDILYEDSKPSMSDYHYTKVRKVILERLKQFVPVVLQFDVPIPKREAMKKAEQLKQANSDRLVEEDLQRLLSTPFDPNRPQRVELRLFSLYLLLTRTNDERTKFDIIASILKFNFQDQPIAPLGMKDFELVKGSINFDWVVGFAKYYEVIENPTFLFVLPKVSTLKLYPTQLRTLDIIAKYKSCLIVNRASLSSGKTTTAVKLAYDYQNTNKTVVFCCANITVRQSIARLSSASGVNFSIDYIENGALKEEKNRSESRVAMIITDYYALQKVLEKPSSNDFILFIDEPTFGADQPNSPHVRAFLENFERSPPQTLLVSGTLPPLREFEQLYRRHKMRHQASVAFEINDTTSRITSNLETPEREYWVPETDVETVEDLGEVLEGIKQNRFMTRFHNARHLLYLNSQIQLPDLTTYFNDPNNWKQQQIADKIREILNSLEEDIIVEKATVPAVVENFPPVEELFTTSALSFFGGCFVASTTPFEDAKEQALNLFQKVNPSLNWDSLYAQIWKRPDRVVRSEKELTSARLLAEREREKQEFETGRPIWNFPPSLQINSRAHINRFHNAQVNRDLFVPPLGPDDIPNDLNIPREYVVLLAMGIGIFKEDLPPNYLEVVSSLMLDGKIPFVFADVSVAYGTNAPFNHLIIIDPLIITNHSSSTLIQLITRIGRNGKVGTIRTTTETLVQRFEDLLNGEKDTVERDNILKMLKSLFRV